MKKFKKDQTVYYYRQTGPFRGEVVAGTISGAKKDLLTGEVTYEVNVFNSFIRWSVEKETVKASNLYTREAAVLKDYKDEIAYNELHNRLNDMEKAINKIFSEYADKIKADPGFATLSLNKNDAVIMIDGIGDLKAEFNKLKKEVGKIKKTLKKPAKQPVIKNTTEESATQTVTGTK